MRKKKHLKNTEMLQNVDISASPETETACFRYLPIEKKKYVPKELLLCIVSWGIKTMDIGQSERDILFAPFFVSGLISAVRKLMLLELTRMFCLLRQENHLDNIS